MPANLKSQDALLAVSLCPRLGFKQFAVLQGLLPNIEELFYLKRSELRRLPLSAAQAEFIASTDWSQVTQIKSRCQSFGAEITGITDEHYPQQLKHIPQPPLILFTKGDLSLLSHQQLAIVGSRSPSHYGKQMTRHLIEQLATYDIAITSGLALGIDTIAHHAALEQKTPTVAVLGTGIDVVYPKSNWQLYEQISNQGLLVSEFLPGQPPVKYNFPRRNRIISGLSRGTLVVEAAIKSGSLITAEQALEQGRDVFAVPGSVFNKLSEGTNHLIQQGAKPVTCAADIVEEYVTFQIQQQVTKNHLAESKLLASVDHDTTPVDVIIQRSNLPMDKVLTELLELEVQGAVLSVPGGYIKVANQL